MTFKPFPELIRELIQDFKPTAPPPLPPSAYARTHRVVAGLHTKRWHILFQYLAMQTILVVSLVSCRRTQPARLPTGPPRPATPQAAPAQVMLLRPRCYKQVLTLL